MTTQNTPAQKAEAARICNAIWGQLGGQRFAVMTGSTMHGYTIKDNGNTELTIKLKRNKSKANFLKIELTSMDLYDVKFVKANMRTGIKTMHEVEGYYDDMLAPMFEEVTGLYTKF